MKRLLALVLALCLLLSACEQASVSNSAPPDPSSSASTPVPAAPPEDSASPAYTPPDYSSHAEVCDWEDEYIVQLADLDKLAAGEKALAMEVGPDDWSGTTWSGEFTEYLGYDARSCDLSGEDLSGVNNWDYISFNTDTVWLGADQMPEGFDPEAVLELGKDPGLGIRALHEQGITGEGVGIAIIDQPLYTGHEQYRDNLMLYKVIHASPSASMHGAAVSSIAMGKDVGVAPGAKLYFIACSQGHGSFEYDASLTADAIDRILEINRHLPEDEKIRVISISLGFWNDQPGFQEFQEAVQRAKDAGMLVLTTTPDIFYPRFSLRGVERDTLADPNDPQSYRPASLFRSESNQPDAVLVPIGSRTFAGCTGETAFEWGYFGGMSWAAPWLAGFYALCCQVDPGCTPEQFLKIIHDTATVKLTASNKRTGTMNFYGRIIDPAAAVAALKGQ